MPAASLRETSLRLCLKNLDHLEDVGDISYNLIRPVLLKIENPTQLRRIETASPQLLGQDGELWLNFIKSDISRWQTRQLKPSDPTKWYELYTKLQQDVAAELQESEKKLQAALNKHQSKKEESRSTFIAKPLDPRRTTGLGSSRPWGVTDAAKPKLSPLEKLVKGPSRKGSAANKEGKRPAGNRNILATPTHLLNNRQSRVMQVPKAMVTPTPKKPSSRPLVRASPDRNAMKIFAPRVPSKFGIDRAVEQEKAKERERRLKAIQAGQTPEKARVTEPAVKKKPVLKGSGGKEITPEPVVKKPGLKESGGGKETTPEPVGAEKRRSPGRGSPFPASPPPFVKKRKVESVFMSSKKRRV
ncbi:MAG: hypothetical protein M1821_006677 [Bathelium mastoideum]|nr:MAG: hypothetical protein M1821_006677 [Bathelium mastoideum]